MQEVFVIVSWSPATQVDYHAGKPFHVVNGCSAHKHRVDDAVCAHTVDRKHHTRACQGVHVRVRRCVADEQARKSFLQLPRNFADGRLRLAIRGKKRKRHHWTWTKMFFGKRRSQKTSANFDVGIV